MKGVQLTKLVQEMNLTNLTPSIDLKEILIKTSEINRPALQLTGYYDFFNRDRVQIVGKVEFSYLNHLEPEVRRSVFEEFVSKKEPCIIFTSENRPEDELLALCVKYDVPALSTTRSTSELTVQIIRYLSEKLAPSIAIHGVFVDVFGEGVLIMGESGIGKSEAALELIKRGHRLVSDDVVKIHKISDYRLEGSAPDITRHFIELRGIGIIDVKSLFGIECVENKHRIDLVINLKDWQPDMEYDRLGLENNYTEILGNKVVSHTIPIRPGRNLAIIVETAAINHRQKKMGYNAAEEMYNRVQNNILKRKKTGN